MWLIDISNIQISGVCIVSISPPRLCFRTNNIPAWALLPPSPIVLTCYLLNSFCLTRSRAQHERHMGIYKLWKGYPVSSPVRVYGFEPLLSVSMTVNLQLCDCCHRTCRPAPAQLILPHSLRHHLCVTLIRDPWESILLTPLPKPLILRCDFEGYLFYGRALAAGPPPSLSGKDGTQPVHRRVGSC